MNWRAWSLHVINDGEPTYGPLGGFHFNEADVKRYFAQPDMETILDRPTMKMCVYRTKSGDLHIHTFIRGKE